MPRQKNYWFAPVWLIPVLLAAGVAGALLYYRTQMSVTEPTVSMPVEVVAEDAPSVAEAVGPVHPVETGAPATDDQPLTPLPSLGESDDYFKIEFVELFGVSLGDRLAGSGMIEKFVATIDNLPRAHVADRIRPLTPVAGRFLVDGQDASGGYAISSANYSRYDDLVELLGNTNLDDVMQLYRKLYPLFQNAYEEQGYPDAYFNDRLVEVVDHLLQTPEVAGPIELVRPHVMYEFRDADLEALSSGQKMILRLGEQHAATVKRRLRELRALLTAM